MAKVSEGRRVLHQFLQFLLPGKELYLINPGKNKKIGEGEGQVVLAFSLLMGHESRVHFNYMLMPHNITMRFCD